MEERIAFSAAMRMVAMSLPDSAVERPEGLHERIAEFVQRSVDDRGRWQPIDLSVNDVDTVGRRWKFAHWELAYARPVEEHPFVVVTNNSGLLPSINIVSLPDTHDYGFSVREGFTAAAMKPAFDPPGSFHEDYTELLSR